MGTVVFHAKEILDVLLNAWTHVTKHLNDVHVATNVRTGVLVLDVQSVGIARFVVIWSIMKTPFFA